MREKSNKSALASAATRNYSLARRIQGRFRVGQRGAKNDTPSRRRLAGYRPRGHIVGSDQGRTFQAGGLPTAGDAAHQVEVEVVVVGVLEIRLSR